MFTKTFIIANQEFLNNVDVFIQPAAISITFSFKNAALISFKQSSALVEIPLLRIGIIIETKCSFNPESIKWIYFSIKGSNASYHIPLHSVQYSAT